MNQHLQTILNFIQQSEHLSDEEKVALIKSAKEADKELEITSFKLERTEKVKHTTAILLEETIEELEQKRKAIEAQNHELEIEASLERVRTVAMSMKYPADMLEVCCTISHQLKALHVKEIRNVQTAIFYESKGTYMNYEYYAKHDKTIITETSFTNHKMHREFAAQMLKGKGEFFTTYITKAELPDWIAYQKTTNVFIDTYLETATSLNYYWYSLGPVALGISTYKPLKEEDINLFKRFLKVFELSYTRYLDIEQAIAQSRESQIQLALERVRARTMAMQKSDELTEAALLLFEQLQSLGAALWSCGFNIFEKEDKECTSFIARGGKMLEPVKLSLSENRFMRLFNESKQKEQEFWFKELTGEDSKSIFGYVAKQRQVQAGNVSFLSEVTLPPKQIVHLVNFSHGNLMFITLEPHPEFHDVFKRLGKVFEQTYTRFLDLQKAEAQARENQIQLALERARTQSMIMQHSTELDDILRVFHEQALLLGIPSAFSFLWLPDEEKGRHIFWAAWAQNNLFKSKAINYPLDRNEPATAQCLIDWKRNESVVSYHVPPTGVENYFAAWSELIAGVEELKPGNFNDGLYYVEAFMKYGCFGVMVKNTLPEDEKKILGRFAVEFERAYTRFLDLKKAEAQARESQIQLALERVRARTMAMQKSDELKDAASLLFQQISALGVHSWTSGFQLWDEDRKAVTVWTCTEGIMVPPFIMPATEEASMIHILEAAQRGETLYVEEMGGEALENHYKYMTLLPTTKAGFESIATKGITLPTFQIFHAAYFSYGYLLFITHQPCPEAHDIFKRFANVFEQTYTRFLDLQKAEAQARESQIEASLERVRSRSMGMQKSEELKEVIQVVYEQFVHLNINVEHTGFIMDYKTRNDMHIWLADKHEVPSEITIPYFDSPHWNSFIEAKEKGNDFFANLLTFEEKNKFYQELFKLFPVPDEAKEYYFTCPGLAGSTVLLDNVGLYIENFSGIPYSDEENAVLMRFGKVFQQTYTRFLDLQKAEAQAREAKIEAGLERVRSRAMAMHNSEELAALIGTVFAELTKLDIALTRCVIWIFDVQTNGATWWMANSEDPENPINCEVPYNAYEPYLIFLEQWKKKTIKFQYELKGKIKKDWDKYLFNKTGLSRLPDFVIAGMKAPECVLLTASFNNFGAVNAASLKPLSDEHTDIMLRFAKVFDLTYTRFNDLKQAEASAREAQIEAALERVRAKAMAMQKPNELVEVAQLLRKEMGLLGVEELETSSIYIHDEATGKTECWYAIMKEHEEEKKLISDHMTIALNETWVGKQMLKFYRSDKKQISIPMKGVERNEWINYCADHSNVLAGFYGDNIPDRTYHLYKFSGGYMGAASPGDISAESWNLLQRATSVFSLAYTRFSDLIKSEANAKEAIKQSALDRIRADIASMRTTNDLERITPLIWNELNILGVPFIRCGVFIMNDEQQLIHTFLSTPDGKAIAAFHIPYDTPGNIKHVISHWHNNKNYIDHWDEDAFTEFAKMLVTQGALTSSKQYLKTVPHGGFYLHFLPFLQGMLYVGNTNQLVEEISLLQSIADAFSTAYARYEDFNKLEAAKKQVDITLNELQATQKQLIQSEKMASLGELTAGIAHEIQNPLNFVNNFSEVNNELIIELVEEVDKGNYDEVKVIAKDIKDNEEKINHHGKRAGAIVKGMLQHSRKSEGKKEPTDINALCDEYLRLSYHGLRAKDKTFNADFKTDFDKSIDKINIVPQDMGRVLLNLINNAFYAVNERWKTEGKEFKAMVIIQTKKINNNIEIHISDNGNGIPLTIKEKIFQPFFTTKPTGSGTGLGLGLSYDIIKVHGGEIKVETKEGEGSAFIISLPA